MFKKEGIRREQDTTSVRAGIQRFPGLITHPPVLYLLLAAMALVASGYMELGSGQLPIRVPAQPRFWTRYFQLPEEAASFPARFFSRLP